MTYIVQSNQGHEIVVDYEDEAFQQARFIANTTHAPAHIHKWVIDRAIYKQTVLPYPKR
jgi:hypothetical protein